MPERKNNKKSIIMEHRCLIYLYNDCGVQKKGRGDVLYAVELKINRGPDHG